ncbi:hypothetical protein EBT16_11495 [bacterium]|nr:hypothetical protein [bacterium]
MTIEARKMEVVTERAESAHLNLLQKYVLMRAHPRRAFLDTIAMMWEVYFLWNKNWRAALGIFLVMNTVGIVLGRKVNYEAMASTVLGKLALLHTQPMNLLLQLTGAALLVYGLHLREGLTIMTSVSLIFLGHFYGWSRVHPSLKIRD